MRRIIAVLGAMLAMGCSPVARIASDTNGIRAEASALVKHGEAINDPIVIDKATRIETWAADIHQTLPHVEDKTPAWLSTLQWWGIAVAVVAIAFVLWQSGAFTFLRIAIGWLPRKQVREADMAVAMLDDNKAESPREMVAARRAADPLFDAAYRRARANNDKSAAVVSQKPRAKHSRR